jgi:SAM-dependent methyltransferase
MQNVNIFKPTDKVLELGCGENPIRHDELWHTMDSRKLPTVDIVWDVNNQPFPIESESYDGVYASFIMEHIRLTKVRGFIAEVHRILKPLGTAVIITSNLYEQAKVVIEKEEKGEVNDDIIHMVFGGKPDYEENYHHSSLTPNFAVRLLKETGFHEATIYEHPVAKQIWGKSTDMIVVVRKSGAHIEVSAGRTVPLSNSPPIIPKATASG